MKFTTPCFVRVEDAEKRKELTEWLQGIGYYVCPCCLFDGWNTLHCNRIERLYRRLASDSLKRVRCSVHFD